MLSVIPIGGLPEIQPGCDLGQMLADALREHDLRPRDILVVTQKIVSKAEGRFASLSDTEPSPHASDLAVKVGKDPRLVELVLRESTAVVRAASGVLITRHRCGMVMANAGIDRSNLGADTPDQVLLLPLDSDASAKAIRDGVADRTGIRPGVIVSDSFGRPWRHGVTHVAIGAAGLPALLDRRGEADRDGRVLEVTQIGLGDMIACAAGLVMGEGAEGVPAALLRGLDISSAPHSPASATVRSLQEDLFQ